MFRDGDGSQVKRYDVRKKGRGRFAVGPAPAMMSQTLPEFPRAEVKLDFQPSTPTQRTLRLSSSAPAGKRSTQREKVLRAFDQRVSDEFEHMELQARPASQHAHSPSRSEDILSEMARRENVKQDRYSQHIDRGATADGKKGSSEQSGQESHSGVQVKVASPQAFEADVKKFEGFMEELAKSVRFEHLDGALPQDKWRQAEMEAVRRRKEEELRRARKKEQEARDPHIKIKIKLENKRQFEGDKVSSAQGVPMQFIEFTSVKGKEQVKLVDPRALRSACLGMDEGDRSVSQLLSTKGRKEQSERLSKLARSIESGSSPLFHSWGGRTDPGPILDLEERLSRTKAVAESRRVDRMLHKLSQTRSEPLFGLPYKIDLAGEDASGERLLGFQRSPKRPGTEFARKIAERHGEDFILKHGDALAGGSQELQKLLTGRDKTQKFAGATPTAAENRRASSQTQRASEGPVDVANVQEKKGTGDGARKNWVKARALVHWLVLYRFYRRRSEAIWVVKGIIKQCGEWSRIRRSIFRVRESIRFLQRRARYFLEKKRKRVDEFGKVWQKVEDQYLASYFKENMKKILQDKAEEVARFSPPPSAGSGDQAQTPPRAQNKKNWVATLSRKTRKTHDFYQKMSSDLDNGTFQFPISAFKIPDEKRRAIISKWYMNRLRTHVRGHQNFMTLVQTVIQSEKELVEFLKTLRRSEDGDEEEETQHAAIGFGVDYYQDVVRQPGDSLAVPFYAFTEEFALTLIIDAARSMVHIPPFEEHPASKDLAEQRMLKKNMMAESAKLQAFNMADASDSRAEPASNQVDEDKRDKPVDITDLLKFTPRLREISEEQAAEYRAVNSNSSPRNEVHARVAGAINPL